MMPMTEPLDCGFEYDIKLKVCLPLTWASFIKKVAENHYDAAVKTSADRGPINGLYNCAFWTEERNATPSDHEDYGLAIGHPISLRDLDTICKAMEPARYLPKAALTGTILESLTEPELRNMINGIDLWLKQSMKTIYDRYDEIRKV